MQGLYHYQGEVFQNSEELNGRLTSLHERWNLELLPCLIELSKKTNSDIFTKEGNTPNGILKFECVHSYYHHYTDEVLCGLKFILSNLKPTARGKGSSCKNSADEHLKMMVHFVNVS